jgi:ParB family chromosome partitioning protein
LRLNKKSPALHRPVQFQTIPLNRIDHRNDIFRITTRNDVEDLAASIQSSGLITPPTVIETGSVYTIVSGFRRVTACRNMGCDDILARILGPGTRHLDCLRLAIADNALQRPLNLIETSRALHKLSRLSDDMHQLADIADSCGLPRNHSAIRKIRDLCLLPMPVQQAILNETIQLTTAGELALLPEDVAVLLAGLFERLQLSLNKQRETMTLVAEIARRDNLSMQQVLAHESLRQIADDDTLDRAQKARQVRAFLRQWRFPRIVVAEQRFQSHLKKLKLGRDLKLYPPKDFEGDHYSLVMRFNSVERLRALHTKIGLLLKHPNLIKIMDD